MDESRYMEPLELAGQIIMENGGETYRVEETISRMGKAFGLEKVESFAVPSGVFVSYRKSSGETETAVLRVHKDEINMTRVNAVNAVSREVEAGQLDDQGALKRLREIQNMAGPFDGPWLIVGCGLCAAGFSAMFGGGIPEFLVAGAVSALCQALAMALKKHKMQALPGTLLCSFLSAFLPGLLAQATPLLLDATVAGALMPLLPGLAMTNAVQDTMRGDMVSGLSSGISAILTAGLVAGGTLLSSTLLRLLGGLL